MVQNTGILFIDLTPGIRMKYRSSRATLVAMVPGTGEDAVGKAKKGKPIKQGMISTEKGRAIRTQI